MPQHFDHPESQGNSTFMLGLMAGTAIGAGVALLFAPREGAALRRELSNGAHKLGEHISHSADAVRQTARRAADSATDLIERGRSAYSDAASSAREAAEQGVDQMEGPVEDAADAATRAVRQTASTVERAAGRAQQL